MSIVYKAKFPNNKVYIGITSKSLDRRKAQHKCAAIQGSPYKIHRAIRKYGWDSIQWEIIFESPDYELIKSKEVHFISEFDSYKSGYNMTLGGDGQLGSTFNHSNETKEKISKNNAKYWKGKSRSDKTKQKLSESQRGISKGPMAEDTKQKLSKLRKGELNGMFGKPAPNRGLPIQLICKKSNKTLIFSTQHDAAKFLKVTQSTISNYLKNKSNNKNFIVKYKDAE